MKLEIVLDTETTGLDPSKGHRLVEIGCIELFNFLPTGKEFHCYINPEREMTPEAFAVHGLSTEFLAQFKPFASVVKDFLAFIEGANLVIHNAGFDLKFLNAELAWAGFPKLLNPVTDTLAVARRKFPGSPASLDALCRRFGVDNKSRDKHGALLDAQLLASVYLELQGGRQPTFGFDAHQAFEESLEETTRSMKGTEGASKPIRPIRFFPISPDTLEKHTALLTSLKAPAWELPPEALLKDIQKMAKSYARKQA